MTSSRTANPLHQFPIPAGAVLVDGWNDTRTPTAFRFFEGSRRVVDRPHDTDIDVYISGSQHHDGSVSREIVVHELNADHPLTIKQARQLAAALTELVAEAETMAGYEPNHGLMT
jgi:hypothetical protein